MKTIEKIVVFLCAYLFCGWGTLFVQNANADIDPGNLRVFAYGLRVVYSEATETYTFYFKSTSAPKSGELVFYYDKDGDENQNELSSIVGRYTIPSSELTTKNADGEYDFSLDKKDIPVKALDKQAYLNMTWAIELKGDKIIGRNPEATEKLDYSSEHKDWSYNRGSYQGTSNKLSNGEGALQAQVKEPRRMMEEHKFLCPQGIAIDNNPHSPYFGRVYIANAPTAKQADIPSSPYAQGIVIYEPDPTTGKYILKKVVEIEDSFFHTDKVEEQYQRYFLHRIAVNPVSGNVYFCSSGSNYQSAVYQLKPTPDGLDWANKINVTEQLITASGFATHPLHPINSFAFGPGGELYVMSAAKSGTRVNDSESKPRGNGKIYKLTKSDKNSLYYDGFVQHYKPRTTPQETAKGNIIGEPFNIDPWVDADNSMVVNARGGFWVTQHRDAVDEYAFLAQIHPDNPEGYQSNSTYGKNLEPYFQFVMSKVTEETFSRNHLSPYSTTKQLLDTHTPDGTLNSDYTSPCGQVAIYEKNGLSSTEAFLAVGFKGRVCVFKLLYNEHGTWYGFNYDWMFEIPIGDKNSTIDGLAFDYAGNLFVASETRHKLYVYSLPNYQPMLPNNSPAMQPLTFEKVNGGRLENFENAGSSTDARNNLNRGKPLDDNHVATPAKFDWTVDAAIVYDQKYNSAFDTQWSTKENWNIQRIPGEEDIPVIIRSNAIIRSTADIKGEHSVSGLMLENGSHLTIAHDGGLTVGEGGITGATDNGSSITIQNHSTIHPDKIEEGAGYLRIHPSLAQETMPRVTVDYHTKSQPSEAAGLENSNDDRLWQYFGAPGDNTTISISNHTWIYQWVASDGVESGYWNEKLGTFPLTKFMGYAITQAYMPSYEWTTTPINQNHEVSWLGGDYIFANSYLAPINVAAFEDDKDFEGGVDKVFYIFNTGSWNEWRNSIEDDEHDKTNALTSNQSAGQYTAISVESAKNLDPNYDRLTIAPMQGVYVRSKGPGKIKLDYTKHVWETENPGTTAMRAPEKTVSPDLLRRIRIQAYGKNSGSDRMYILQDMSCTPDYDNGYDGKNINAKGQVNIYTNEPCGKMEISSTNQIDGMYIGFRAGPDTTYTLRFTSLIGDSLCIKDLANDSIIALYEDSTYTFYAAAKSVNNMRFQVLLHPNPADDYSNTDNSGTTTDLDNVSTSQMWITDQHLCISNQKANSTAKIYSVSGQLLISEKFNYQIDIPVYNLTTGVYILEVNNERYKFIRQN